MKANTITYLTSELQVFIMATLPTCAVPGKFSYHQIITYLSMYTEYIKADDFNFEKLSQSTH